MGRISTAMAALCVAAIGLAPATAQTTAPAAATQPRGPAVTAAQVTPAVRMDLEAHRTMRAMVGDSFDEGHLSMLHALGHQKAVVANCAGFTIDEKAFRSEMDLIYDGQNGQPLNLTAAQRLDLERKATLAFGTALGAQVAIAAMDKAAFCRAATAERASGKVSHLVYAK